ncbi:hypothetical protein V499_03746 [Pseudogymnoascus sp. VKM F-103]|uniref:FAR-17a/AIG1-like protein n=1 Tax=Pseudogymnoascus verrucosus TaxID=342668 RepID=A0A1B8GW06_9PEZI|nr:uncharacterized protein VE01_01692 [Pseudogymnoascus verrucosus]KFY76681.1 hypothetical protein V499_03746 [Pseudogymnoascus sp. VKM F-103]OBU00010.1 hypothetical protein VE01_01692 [Pseudogymnoascus verrucosus]
MAKSKSPISASRKHPLQRFESPSRAISFFLHALGLCSFSGSFWYMINFPTQMNQAYGWHYQYLTIIGLLVSTITFGFGLLADITLSHRLFNIKNSLSLWCAPLEVLITILYWTISAIDRELVIPPEINLDPYADISFHFMPSLLLVLDLLLLSPPYTIKNLPAAGLSTALAFTYWAWIEHCFTHNGFYPYPLFDILSTTHRAILFGSSALLMTGSTILLKWLYAKINGVETGNKRTTPANIKGE